MKRTPSRLSISGFTLVEIMTVVAVIAIMLMLIVVSMNRARERTRDTIIISQLEQIQALAETVYNPQTGYKELYDMREDEHDILEELGEKVEEMGGAGFNFHIRFPEDISGEVGYDEYCVWVKLIQQPRDGPERNFCVDSAGRTREVEWDSGEIEYNCRVEEVPLDCEYRE